MADFASFYEEFIERLKRDRMMFVSEIVALGNMHGLSEPQVQRVIAQAVSSGLGFLEASFIYVKVPDNR